MRTAFHRILAFTAALVLSLSVVFTAFAAYDTIPYGEQSDSVRKMQTKLKEKGYYAGAVDGKFGPDTLKAVRKYQAYLGIRVDGKPGNKTLSALYAAKGTNALSSAINSTGNSELRYQTNPSNPRSLYYGCTGARVRALQRALRDVGCYGHVIDGVYGDLTYAAVKKYQSQKGLHADGIAGTKTIASLNKNAKYRIGTSMIIDVGSVGREVKVVKSFLNRWGYQTSKGDTFSEMDRKAVTAWQTKTGKKATGTISESQYNAIVLRKEEPKK